MVEVKKLVEDLCAELSDKEASKSPTPGIPTGLRDIDAMIGGLRVGQVTLVGGRPGTGKSALVDTMLVNIACYERVPSALVCPGRSAIEVVRRLLAMESRTRYQYLERGFVKESDWSGLRMAASILSEASLIIDDTARVTLMDLRDKVVALREKHGCRLLLLDCAQSLAPSGDGEFFKDETWPALVARELRLLARELQVAIVCVTQLRSWSYTTAGSVDDGRPRMTDIATWYPLHQVADSVILLDGCERPEELGVVDLLIAKNCSGPTGTVKLQFSREYLKFRDLAVGSYSDDD